MAENDGVVYVVDYDIPAIPKIRMRFYREIRQLLHNGDKYARYSTQSVLITEDEILAKSIYMIAKKYGKARIYRAYEIVYEVEPELVTPVRRLIADARA